MFECLLRVEPASYIASSNWVLISKFLFQGFPPGQQLPFSASFLQGSAPKKGAFPPESVDPGLLNMTSQLMNHFNDKAWPYMWFLNRGGRGSHGLDMNVDEAWAQGVSGQSAPGFENYYFQWATFNWLNQCFPTF